MEHERNGTIFRREPSSNIEEHPKTVDYSSMMALEHTIDFIKVEIGIPTSQWYKKEKIVVKTTVENSSRRDLKDLPPRCVGLPGVL